MELGYKNTNLSKAVLGGVFTGILVSAANLIFDYAYRFATGYSFSEIINVPSIIIFSMASLLICGILYYLANKYLGREFIYIAFFVALTVAAPFVHLGTTMPNGAPIAASAHGLTVGVFLITGLAAAFLVPYMAHHEKIWS